MLVPLGTMITWALSLPSMHSFMWQRCTGYISARRIKLRWKWLIVLAASMFRDDRAKPKPPIRRPLRTQPITTVRIHCLTAPLREGPADRGLNGLDAVIPKH